MEHDIYSSLHFKAAALLQTLAKLPCLEHSTEAYLRDRVLPARAASVSVRAGQLWAAGGAEVRFSGTIVIVGVDRQICC